MSPDRKREVGISASAGSSRITVAVVAATPLEQAALQALLSTLPGLGVVAATATTPPQVLLWLPQADDALPALDESTAVLAIVANTSELPPTNVSGLFAKDESPEALSVAIRQIARGQEYFSPSLALSLLRQQDTGQSYAEGPDLEALTSREREVLVLLGQGLSNKAIASRLYLSVRTVEGHLSNAYAKLEINSRTEAALLAARLL